MRLAIDLVNSAGGLAGRPLALEVRDSHSDDERGTQETKDLLQAANISGWCCSSPFVMVMKLQTNIPAFQRYCPLLTYPSAVSKFGFSTKRSALKKVVLVFFAPGGVGNSCPT